MNMGINRDDFIAAMRGVASSVAVVTTGGPAGRYGTTVTSFCSVSADPPAMLTCIHAQSRFAPIVEGNGHFAINVLSEGEEQIAQRFAGADDDKVDDRFTDIALHPESADVPLIAGATVLLCKLDRLVDGNTHRIVIGSVTMAQRSSNAPLLYMAGDYQALAT
ncbi:MAG: flavin reductase family protein [Pseudomonadota bacterium]